MLNSDFAAKVLRSLKSLIRNEDLIKELDSQYIEAEVVSHALGVVIDALEKYDSVFIHRRELIIDRLQKGIVVAFPFVPMFDRKLRKRWEINDFHSKKMENDTIFFIGDFPAQPKYCYLARRNVIVPNESPYEIPFEREAKNESPAPSACRLLRTIFSEDENDSESSDDEPWGDYGIPDEPDSWESTENEDCE